MTLDQALRILCEVHTRDDDRAGYVVEMLPSPARCSWVSQSDYAEAWAVARRAIGVEVDPPVWAVTVDLRLCVPGQPDALYKISKEPFYSVREIARHVYSPSRGGFTGNEAQGVVIYVSKEFSDRLRHDPAMLGLQRFAVEPGHEPPALGLMMGIPIRLMD